MSNAVGLHARLTTGSTGRKTRPNEHASNCTVDVTLPSVGVHHVTPKHRKYISMQREQCSNCSEIAVSAERGGGVERHMRSNGGTEGMWCVW